MTALLCAIALSCEHDITEIRPGWGAMENAPDGENRCGNGVIEGGEQCEEGDLAGQDCRSQGFEGGNLRCDMGNCRFDTSECHGGCGNNQIEQDEQCDGFDLNGENCRSRGYEGGDLRCDPGSCTFDESECNRCGNGEMDDGEQCDGPDMNGQDCMDRGYASGELRCNFDCSFDESSCRHNGEVDGGPDVQEGWCGDGNVNWYRDERNQLVQEVCDDGNQMSGDGCSSNCLSDESCGNNIVDSVSDYYGNYAYQEACDDGNTDAGDGCSPDCWSDETCGNGYRDENEICDDGNTADGDDCSSDCQTNNMCPEGALVSAYMIQTMTDAARLGGCTSVAGTLTVEPEEHLNLRALRDLQSVGGHLTFGVPSYGGSGYGGAFLTDLTGLENLMSVGGDLKLGSSYDGWGTSLRNVNALSNLSTVNGKVEVYNNHDLIDLNGLSGLTSVGGSVDINSNPELIAVGGFSGVGIIPGRLNINYNNQLRNLDGMEDITQVNEDVEISSNSALENIDGLQNLLSVGQTGIYEGSLYIQYNENLFSLGLSSLQRVEGYLYIQDNALLDNLDGPSALTYVGYDVYITNNPNLDRADAFGELLTIGSYLYIYSNDDLRTVSMPNLQSIQWGVNIYDNFLLNSLALGNFDFTSGYGSLNIHTNASLPNCQATSIRNRLDGMGTLGSWQICDNLPTDDACYPSTPEPCY